MLFKFDIVFFAVELETLNSLFNHELFIAQLFAQ